MVNDRLHIICGNCGHDKEYNNFEWEYEPADIAEDGEVLNPAEIYISCKNCATLHTLGKYAKQRRT